MRRATDEERSRAKHALLSAVIELGEATTDDAHERFELPLSVDQRAWGTITCALRLAGLIQRVDDAQTRRQIAHGRRIGVWAVADGDKAQQELADLTAAKRRPEPPRLPGFDW
jgi:hypothetical protein